MTIHRLAQAVFCLGLPSLLCLACSTRSAPTTSLIPILPTITPIPTVWGDPPNAWEKAIGPEFGIPVAYPQPTGPFVVGVHDFEFVDTIYPVDREEDVQGRRLMVRVWYPAASPEGNRRRYFEGRELEVLGIPTIEAIAMFVPDARLLKPLGDILTHGYEDAPLTNALDSLPTVVFSHGGLSYVSQNTALMEELSSHGYLVFSLTHPGGSSGILYPNGDAVQYDRDYHAAVLGAMSTIEPDGLHSSAIAKRYAARSERWIDDGGLGPWLSRWRDDNIALVDFIQSSTAKGLLGEILQKADLGRLAYAGMSYGAAAAASAAQADQRARAVINLDGTHQASDLLNTNIRVPLLVFTSEPVARGVYTNEFFYEPLTAMGTRKDIVRVWIPEITHMGCPTICSFPNLIVNHFLAVVKQTAHGSIGC
ncbi:hypothetical protein KFU94_70380 [Chloroflexi bacterium TSY]|nr:hypothetical protein [Chloroflexi bacterium TSY]